MQFKVRYIEAFNLMQRALQAQHAEMIRGLDPAVIGGVVKAVMGRLIATNAIGINEETARKIFAELIEAREAGEDTYHVTKGEISSLELAIKYGTEQHGRRWLVNRFTSRLKAICLNKKLRARKNRLGTWIFPIEVSRPTELHRQPLAEPCVNFSAHTAPIRQTCRSCRSASERRGSPYPVQVVAENDWRGFCVP